MNKKRKQDDFETPETRRESTASNTSSKISPIRTGRLDEKHALQELNSRLELYIFRQREKEAAQSNLQKEFKLVKQEFEGRLKQQRDEYDGEQKIHHEKTKALVSEKAKLEEELKKSISIYDQLSMQFKTQQELVEKLRGDFDGLSKESQRLKLEASAAEQNINQLGNDVDFEKDNNDRLRRDLDREKRRAHEASGSSEKEKARADRLQAEFDRESQNYKHLLEQYRVEKEKNARRRQMIEDELRKKFGSLLHEKLQERQAEYEKNKDDLREEIKKTYESKIKDKMDQLEAMLRRADDLTSALRQQQEQYASIERKATKAIQLRESLERTITDFESKLREEITKYTEENREKQRIIDNFKIRNLQTDEDFNALMDVKIALALEIKAYRLLLETAEDSAGTTPKPDATASLVITSMELDGASFKIRNGSTENVSLKGWTLRSRETGQYYSFPDRVLPPGESIVVYIGPTEEKVTDDDLVWNAETNIWNPNGDSAQLVSPDQIIVHDAAITTSRLHTLQ